MANLERLIVFLLLFVSASAWATCAGMYSSQANAKAASNALANSGDGYCLNGACWASNGGDCAGSASQVYAYYTKRVAGDPWSYFGYLPSGGCPSGSPDSTGKCTVQCNGGTVVNNVCTCAAGYTAINGTCTLTSCTSPQVWNDTHTACVGCPSGSIVNADGKCIKDCSGSNSPAQPPGVMLDLGGSCDNPAYIDGCTYVRTGDCICAGGHCFGWGAAPTFAPQPLTSFAPSGSGSSPGPIPTNNTPSPVTANQCAQGLCSVTVGGIASCQPCNGDTVKSPGAPTSTTTQNPDGSGTKTDTTKTTSCSNGTCTTTTTKTDTPLGPGGVPGTPTTTTTSDTRPQADICQQNPKMTGCGGSSFTGSCGSNFVCNGDSIMCAIAQAEWAAKCRMETPSDESSTANAAKGAGGGLASGNGSSVVDVPAAINAAMGARFLTPNCVAPPTFSVMGRSFTADTTAFCNFATIAGYIFVAIASVIAVRMIGT